MNARDGREMAWRSLPVRVTRTISMENNNNMGRWREGVVGLSEMAAPGEEGATCHPPMNRRRDEVGLRSSAVDVVAGVRPGLLHVAD